MKRFSLVITLLITSLYIKAQQPLTTPLAIAQKVLCENRGVLEDYWLSVLGNKLIGIDYYNAKKNKDEFKVNKYNKFLQGKYNDIVQEISFDSIYYVTGGSTWAGIYSKAKMPGIL